MFVLAGVICSIRWIPAGAAAGLGTTVAVLALIAAMGVLVTRIAGVSSAAWFAVVSAVFIAALSALIQAFSGRQLRSDLRQRWFVCWVNVLTAASVGVVVAPSVLWFAVAWTSVGVALVALLAMYPDLPQARQGVRRTILNCGIGDAALWVAVITILLVNGGDVGWGRLGAVAATIGAPWQTVVPVLLAIAGLARCAQVPFHTWLPATLAAPTPVSAIMHAGVVNAAVFLVIRFSDILSVSAATMLIIFLAGSATVLVGAAGYLMRPDLKGRLVASTTAQMGFLVMTLGVGAYAAALFHLMGHGLYKANLFLRSGSQIDDLRRRGQRPEDAEATATQGTVAGCLAVLVPTGAIVVTAVNIDPRPSVSALILVGYGCVTAGVFLYNWLLHVQVSRLKRALSVPAVAIAGVAYVCVVHVFDLLVSIGLPAAVSSVPGWALALPLLLVALISLLPIIPSHRVPGLYGVITGLAGSTLPRPRVRHRPRMRQAPLSPIVQELA